jgi:hypothetical protein
VVSDDPARVEKLLKALREVTQKADDLAKEVTQALRADRQVGRSPRTETASSPGKPERRRRTRDRRKAQDEG